MRVERRRLKQDKPELQVTQGIRRTLLQASSYLPRTTSSSHQPAPPRLSPGHLQIRRPFRSIHPPPCHRLWRLMHASYRLDAALPSCAVLVLCLFNIPMVIIDTRLLCHRVLAHSRMVCSSCWRSLLSHDAPNSSPTHIFILYCRSHCQSLQVLYRPIPLSIHVVKILYR